MSEDKIPVIIIPSYRNIMHTYRVLRQVFTNISTLKGWANVTGFSVVAREEMIKDLERAIPIVDLLILYGNTPVELNGFAVQRDDDLGIQLYSSRAEQHKGTMTGPPVSDARYPWIIKRNDNSALLVQYLDGQTSQHFHEQTTEYLLPLAGSTTLHHRKETGLESGTLPEKAFTLIPPGMVHRLSSQGPAINLLCMSPYDPELEDHHYVGLEAIAKRSEIHSP